MVLKGIDVIAQERIRKEGKIEFLVVLQAEGSSMDRNSFSPHANAKRDNRLSVNQPHLAASLTSITWALSSSVC